MKIRLFSIVLIAILAFQSCQKETTSPIKIQLQSPQVTMLEFGGTQKISIIFSSPLRSDATLTLAVSDSTAVYGKDYTTSPDGSSKTITLSVSKGATNATFDFIPMPLTAVQIPRAVKFTLNSVSNDIQLGTTVSIVATIYDDADVVQFSNSSQSVLEFGGKQAVGINFSSPLQSDIVLKVNVADSTAVYGKDYTTLPDGSTKVITLQVSKGATSASFDFTPITSSGILPNRYMKFSFGSLTKLHAGINSTTHLVIVDDASIAQFATTAVKILEFGGTQTVGINLSAPLKSDVTLNIAVKDSSAVYGKDYTTIPSGATKTIPVSIPKGSTTASFSIVPVTSLKAVNRKVMSFGLGGQANAVQFGPNTSLRSEIVDDGSVAEIIDESLTLKELSGAKKIQISFSTPLQYSGNVTVGISDSTSTYGVDYTTVPDGSSKTISLSVLKGATSTSFTIIPITNAGKVVNFKLNGVATAMQLGLNQKLTVTLLDDDLVCYLPMNGNAIDASYAANTTLVEGATLTTGRKSIPNTAYSMDGVSNDIKISNSKILDTLQSLTLTAWIKPVSFAGIGNNAIIEKAYYSHTNPYYQYKLGITGDQHLNFPGSFVFSLSINGVYQNVHSATGTWVPGNWYFVAGTYDGNNMVIYINGVAAASYAVSGKVDHYGTDLYIGLLKNLAAYTPGTFGDIRIYKRALSSGEINSLYSK